MPLEGAILKVTQSAYAIWGIWVIFILLFVSLLIYMLTYFKELNKQTAVREKEYQKVINSFLESFPKMSSSLERIECLQIEHNTLANGKLSAIQEMIRR